MCCESQTQPPQTIQLMTAANPCQCPPSHPTQVNCNQHGGPCVQDESCAIGHMWSWIYCQCICTPESCTPGYAWNSLLCKCEPEIFTKETIFEGTQAEVAVRIAEYVGEPIQTMTSKMVTSVGELEDQIRRGREIDPLTGNLIIRCGDCNSTTSQVGVCLANGCLEMKNYEEQDDSDILIWKTLKSGAKQTYDCYNGTCLLVNGTEGVYTSLKDCMSVCGGITSGGKKPSNVGNKTTTTNPSTQKGAMVYISTDDDPDGGWADPTTHPPAPRDKEPQIFHKCCPTVHNGSYPSVNPCFHWDQWGGTGGFHLYTGVPILGSGCGPHPNAPSGASDPEWCCEWAIITCFAEGDEVEMFNGTMKAIELIKVGDEVKSGRNGEMGIVSETFVHPVNDVVQVVNINGITAEPYHPVLVDNKWIPIKKLGNISNKFIDNWYNLKIEGNTNTNYIIGDLIVSGLGNDCQKLLRDSDKRENQLTQHLNN